MRKTRTTTYALRRRGLPNLRASDKQRELVPAPVASPASPLASEQERQRINFEQRRLEHLRELWRAQGVH
jgi:hypothetical protein